MNFIVSEATFLRYFCPLVIEGNKRGIKSRFFLGRSGKYNDCYREETNRQIQEFCLNNNVDVFSLKEIENFPGLTFSIEGVDVDATNSSHFNVSITYMTDFSISYENYVTKVDHVIMPSKFFAEKYNKLSDKNLYLGSPKYDLSILKDDVIKKYKLSSRKKSLIIFPRIRDLSKINILEIYGAIESLGYEIIVKTRGKDKVPKAYRRGRYFEDESWFPHTTMELIEAVDFVVNFGSTSIKECVLMKTPIINFDIKPFPLVLDELYNFDYCEKFSSDVDSEKLKNSIRNLTKSNLDSCFNLAIQKYLFDPKDTSSRILDRVL